MKSLFDFDVFRRPPADLHERGTLTGSVLTLVSLVVVVVMVVWHVVVYWAFPVRSTEMVVQQFRRDRVNLHLVLDIAMPCPLIDLEVHDVLGTHTLDAARNMRKHRIEGSGAHLEEGREVVSGPDGNDVHVGLHHVEQHEKPMSGIGVRSSISRGQLDSLGTEGMKVIPAMADAREWCRFNGTITVAKLPGRLFIRAHHVHLSETLGAEKMRPEWYNTSHVVRKLEFVDTEGRAFHAGLGSMVGSLLGGSNLGPGQTVSAQLGLVSVLMSMLSLSSPLAPMSLTQRTMSQPRTNWRYDLQVVGRRRTNGEESYDYTMGDYSFQVPETPSSHGADDVAEPLSISYSFSPITVVHKETYQSFLELVRSLLCSLGGCYALLKVLDNSIFIGRSVAAKSREGKLS